VRTSREWVQSRVRRSASSISAGWLGLFAVLGNAILHALVRVAGLVGRIPPGGCCRWSSMRRAWRGASPGPRTASPDLLEAMHGAGVHFLRLGVRGLQIADHKGADHRNTAANQREQESALWREAASGCDRGRHEMRRPPDNANLRCLVTQSAA